MDRLLEFRVEYINLKLIAEERSPGTIIDTVTLTKYASDLLYRSLVFDNIYTISYLDEMT